MSKHTLRTLALIWAAVMIAVISSTATLLISGRSQLRAPDETRISEEDYALIQRYSRLDEVRRTMLDEYYHELDEETLVLGAIRGMAASVEDPYTFYYTSEEMTRQQENSSGRYQGIGTLLENTAEGAIQVVRVYPNTPAEAAGLRAGDVLVAVDGIAISGADGRTYNEAVNMIRGEGGTSVVLTVVRDGARRDITVERGDVAISYASYQVIAGNLGYLSITQFTGDAEKVVMEALDTFEAQKVAGLIIDLRNNPGGLLDQVVNIADRLLPKGVIVYIKDRDGTREDFYSDEAMYAVPLVVLVNDMSASASEILASAVQVFGRGTIIGTNTYGKGVVQSLKTYPEDGAGIQLTTSQYYDGNDRSPQGVGVKPDLELALVGGSVPLEPDPASDNQLAAAIDELRRQASGGQSVLTP